MNIHITMTSGGHFKVTDKNEAELFYSQWTMGEEPIIHVTVDQWKMELRRDCIEAIAIQHTDDELPF